MMVAYLTAVGGMLIHFKLQQEDAHTDWRILWQFSSLSYLLLWLYHLIVFVSPAPAQTTPAEPIEPYSDQPEYPAVVDLHPSVLSRNRGK